MINSWGRLLWTGGENVLAFDGDSTVLFRRISGLSCVAIRKGTDTISELFRMRENTKKLCLGETVGRFPKKEPRFEKNGNQNVHTNWNHFFFEKKSKQMKKNENEK